MLLSKKTSIRVSCEYANLIGHMCYAASKLWKDVYKRQVLGFPELGGGYQFHGLGDLHGAFHTLDPELSLIHI